MPKYRKKPLTIDATRWYKHGDHPAVYKVEGAPLGWGYLATPEGEMRVVAGDWIITGIKGEVYPCKPDVFALTYEQVPNA